MPKNFPGTNPEHSIDTQCSLKKVSNPKSCKQLTSWHKFKTALRPKKNYLFFLYSSMYSRIFLNLFDVNGHDSPGIEYQVFFQYFYPLSVWKMMLRWMCPTWHLILNMHLRYVGAIWFIFMSSNFLSNRVHTTRPWLHWQINYDDASTSIGLKIRPPMS